MCYGIVSVFIWCESIIKQRLDFNTDRLQGQPTADKSNSTEATGELRGVYDSRPSGNQAVIVRVVVKIFFSLA